ncbi:MAG: hypothetical protein JAZ11_10160 [Candidatus Thiodiazotropha lotti]|nr:hypothetical protein [Candidatus Thiodiazotropha lotti]MCG7981796.1 hypothetical protein [Candidatus Thiodiazotropha lotti]
MVIDLELPVWIYRVGETCFSNDQIRAMINRTNKKLSPCGIEVVIERTSEVKENSYAYVNVDTEAGYQNHVDLLKSYRPIAESRLRIFLVKADISYQHGSWTYDPIASPQDEEIWRGAIFITELFNNNSDQSYVDMGYLPNNDSLLHEIGHVLMQEKDHYDGPHSNFFHSRAEMTDDTIFPSQIHRMRDTLRNSPHDYLTRISTNS